MPKMESNKEAAMRAFKLIVLLLLAAILLPALTLAGSSIGYPLNGDPERTDTLLGIDNPAGAGWAINQYSLQSILDMVDSLEIDLTPDTDNSGGAIVAKVTVDSSQTNTAVMQPMHIASDGEWETSVADIPSRAQVDGLLVEAGTGIRKILLMGSWRFSGVTLNKGDYYYLSEVPGTNSGLTNSTAGLDEVIRLGKATGTNSFCFGCGMVGVTPSP